MSRPSVIVLGAGMVGTCTAYHLQQQGFDALLIDRRAPGNETSYGNAGLIQHESVEPYAFPRDLRFVWSALWGQRPEVNLQWGYVWAHLRPLWAYFRASSPARHAAISHLYSTLIRQSIADHAELIQAANAEDLITPGGFRFVFRTAPAFDEACERAHRLARTFGVQSRVESRRHLLSAEPALQGDAAEQLAGAVHWTEPWACQHPGELTQRYALAYERHGGARREAHAESMSPDGSGWRVQTKQGPFTAQHLVVAMGPWSPAWLKPLGYRVPMIIKRGYHRHFLAGAALNHPILDAENGYVLAPMKQGTRLTTGAEFAPIRAPADCRQLTQTEALARQLMDLGTADGQAPWVGARPCMPGMLPVIGPAPAHPGLWFNFGHGHQGFTLGPTTGKLLAQAMASGQTTPALRPFGLPR